MSSATRERCVRSRNSNASFRREVEGKVSLISLNRGHVQHSPLNSRALIDLNRREAYRNRGVPSPASPRHSSVSNLPPLREPRRCHLHRHGAGTGEPEIDRSGTEEASLEQASDS